ncbi:piwi-like protein 4 isoform X1 [Ranitomeya variabilis]|uniref:piwi-like protein 4 isoform X1 n=2 Tax=Ranitomeya variabilis TaxID=490064 RepID=UPI004056E634
MLSLRGCGNPIRLINVDGAAKMTERPPKRKFSDNGHSSFGGSPSQSNSGDDNGTPRDGNNGRSDGASGTVCKVSAGEGRCVLAERGRRVARYLQDLGINSRQTMAHVKDHKAGTSGEPVNLLTNLFGLGLPAEWHLYQYHVDFNPSIASIRLKAALLYSHGDIIGSGRAFHGDILFLSRKLANKVTELTSTTRNGEVVKITVTLTSTLMPGSPVYIQFFSILFKKVFKHLKMYQVGHNYFSPSDPINIPQHKLSLWKGFSTVVSFLEKQLTLSVDVSHKVLRNETVLESMIELFSRVPKERFTEVCEKEFVGMVVLTRYNNKTYRVDDMDWSTKPTDRFPKKDGTQISYVEYYKQQYNVELTDLSQPMLVSTLKMKKGEGCDAPRVVHLLPELCYLTGLSSRALSDIRLMRDLSAETQLNPELRQRRLQSLAEDIQESREASSELAKWGVTLDRQLPVTGRVVPPEKICLRDNFCQPDSAADWSRNTKNGRMIYAKPLSNWILLFGHRNADVAEKLTHCLMKVGEGMGFPIDYPKILQVDDSSASFLRALQHNVNPDLQLVLCILPSQSKDSYDSIKKYLTLEKPLPSQCVKSHTLNRQNMLMSVASKIAMQIICKTGGELWAVEIPLKSLMVIGINVNKDAINKLQSVVGFVASTNSRMTKWFSQCIIQKTSTDFADCLKMCMKGAIEKWQKTNNDLPNRIIIYRDGVGDGQLQMLFDYEIPQLLSLFKEPPATYSPKVTVVVVRKRCTTRFFTQSPRGFQNPPLGTVIDSEVTRPEWYDFFLISQNARQGSVNPTHYNVLYDTNCLRPDHLQRLTYKLCHLYYNWPGVIRVPAPCQYAQKLTFLVGQSIHREPRIELSNTLFYL